MINMNNTVILLFLLALIVYKTNGEGKKSDRPLTNEFPGPLEYISQPFDVLEYFIDLDLTSDDLSTNGKCEIKVLLTGATDTSSFYFNLRTLKPDSVFYYGVRVEPLEVGSPDSADYHYEFPLSQKNIPPGNIKSKDTADIVIWYSGDMSGEKGNKWGGVQYEDGVLFAMGVGFTNNYVSCTQHWAPCYDHPSDKAKFRGRFKVKNDYAVASIGAVKYETTLGDYAIYEWTHDFPCATYLYTFAKGPFVELNIGTDSLPIVIYSQAKDTAASQYAFKLVPKMVEAYEQRFGKYPFEKVGYVNTNIGSMEHETMISFAASIVRTSRSYKDSMNSTAAHELSHMWFGDMATPNDFRDAWLNEGFAVFCESIWQEYMFGYEAYLKTQSSHIKKYIKTYSKNEGALPLYDFPRTAGNYPATIYYKGGAVVGMLRYELGDDVFFSAIRKYLSDNAYGNVTTAVLKQYLENESGKNLDNFFGQWVYEIGWPKLQITVQKNPSQLNGYYKLTIDVKQIQPENYGVYTGLPIELGFKKPDNTYYYKLLTLNDKEQSFTIDSVPEYTVMETNNGPTVRALLEAATVNETEEISSADDKSLELFPNPSDETVYIRFSAKNGKALINLIDSDGRSVISDSVFVETGINGYIINTSQIPSGAYIVNISNESGSLSAALRITH